MKENHWKHWSSSDEDYLIQNYKRLKLKEIASTLGRTHKAISRRVELLVERGVITRKNRKRNKTEQFKLALAQHIAESEYSSSMSRTYKIVGVACIVLIITLITISILSLL